jgi:hypothetical protein
MGTAIDEARAALMRALEQLEDAEGSLDGEAERCDLVVVYSIGREAGDSAWDEVGGWSSTAGPKWIHAALLRRAADAHDDAARAVDDDDDE